MHSNLAARSQEFFENHTHLAIEETVHRYEKGVEIFSFIQIEEEVFLLLLLLLSFKHIYEWTGDVGFIICVCHYDINDGVSLMFSQMEDLEVPAEAHCLF